MFFGALGQPEGNRESEANNTQTDRDHLVT
jgi:hypothetical protein